MCRDSEDIIAQKVKELELALYQKQSEIIKDIINSIEISAEENNIDTGICVNIRYITKPYNK